MSDVNAKTNNYITFTSKDGKYVNLMVRDYITFTSKDGKPDAILVRKPVPYEEIQKAIFGERDTIRQRIKESEEELQRRILYDQISKITMRPWSTATPESIKFELNPNFDKNNKKEKTMEEKRVYIPCRMYPHKMWTQKDGHTIVEWSDGTKTVAKAENPETATLYGGFMACVVKRLYGSTTDAIKKMDEAIHNAEFQKRSRGYAKEYAKKVKAERHKRMLETREKRIRDEMEAMRIAREAEKRLAAEEAEQHE